MKKQILILALLIISLTSFSQGNLQFNQVLTFSRTINTTNYISTSYNNGATYAYVTFTDTTLTVPTGKIWKVEKMDGNLTISNPNGYNGGGATNGIGSLMINNAHKISVSQAYGVIWLKAGDIINMVVTNAGGGYSGSNNFTATYTNFLSILEFNIVQ